ncbi:hypothetical protein FE782_11685 [Paenibacillus antri]|uniref:DUF559 domain-containing protein n=1 Tax=Paenibacillus antri TaxID=2582848 RepID=A0A5R9G6L2_9BACL|nr:hypothetical protein [Paenibacillus antri]TLS52032.1 hypothetical protein FE782_11685 [Paenibacillus antri]
MAEPFESAHERWLQSHLEGRTGERRGRLTRKRYAETLFLRQVWWPLFGSFDALHPEYEVADWRGRSYFADFVWLPGSGEKLVFEVKGFGPHVTEMDRRGYCEELNRETFLQGLGYRVISIPHDDVASRPDVVQSLLRMVLSRFQPIRKSRARPSLIEREIMLLAFSCAGVLRGVDVATHLDVSHRTAVRYLQRLCEKGVLEALRNGAKGERVTEYRVIKEKQGLLGLWQWDEG